MLARSASRESIAVPLPPFERAYGDSPTVRRSRQATVSFITGPLEAKSPSYLQQEIQIRVIRPSIATCKKFIWKPEISSF